MSRYTLHSPGRSAGAGRVIAREHRAQHAPRIPRGGILFREPPDMAGGPVFNAHRRIAQLRDIQAELPHRTRVMTMGEVVASIAHEVNQPLAAIITNGETGPALAGSARA
jgi:C4-dicarboxylate-specific signal transduction histidine kinase